MGSQGFRRTRKLCRAQQISITRSRTPSFHSRIRSFTIDIIGDSVYLFHANLFDLTRQTARVLGCDQPDARRVRPCAASLCCGLCCPLSARQDLGRQGTPTPERRWRQRRLAADGRQTVLYPRLPENQSLANHAWLTI